MVKASKRSQGVSYAIRDIVLPARALEKKGVKVLHLNIGDPIKYDFDTPQHIKDALYEATNDGFNGYSPSDGDFELREVIIKREKNRNNVDYMVEDICVTTGVTEALQMYLNDIYTISANLAGIPAISIPCGYTKDGLPIGVQILGRPFEEGVVLKVAFALEQALDLKRPFDFIKNL